MKKMKRRRRARNEQRAFSCWSCSAKTLWSTHEDIQSSAYKHMQPSRSSECCRALALCREERVSKEVNWWGSFHNICYLLFYCFSWSCNTEHLSKSLIFHSNSSIFRVDPDSIQLHSFYLKSRFD